MANVASGIITFGLGGSHTNMILGFPFNLGFIEVIVGSPPVVGSPVVGSPAFPPIPVPRPPRRGRHGGGGGARPYDDGKVWPDQTEKKEEEKYKTVTIRVTMKGKTTEKIYLVTNKRAETIVEVMKIANTTRKRIKIAVNKMKTRASQIVTKVTNIRKKDD